MLGLLFCAWGEFAEDEFLGEIVGYSSGGGEQSAGEDESWAVVAGRVIEVGDCAGGEVSADAGVVELPVTVVSFAEYGEGDGVADAGADGAGSQ